MNPKEQEGSSVLKRVRHRIVKVIAPTLYKGHLLQEQRVSRPMIEAIKKTNQKNLVGAEIGVSDGFNAERILNTLDLERLYGIDPYEAYIDGDGKRVCVDYKREEAINRLKRYPAHQFVFKRSNEAVEEFPPLDFVYIDGNHSYEAVKDDIALYYPLVKKGGFIGGHDFFGKYQGVVWAVIEFVKEHNLTLHTQVYDWWLVKP